MLRSCQFAFYCTVSQTSQEKTTTLIFSLYVFCPCARGQVEMRLSLEVVPGSLAPMDIGRKDGPTTKRPSRVAAGALNGVPR